MEIKRIPTGLLGTNTFIISHKETRIIIDPADSASWLMEYLEEIKPSAILLTHGHFDHIGGADTAAQRFNIPIYIHEDDREMVDDGEKNGSRSLLFRDITIGTEHIKTVSGDSNINIKDINVRVLHTPGHSKGSVSYLIDNHLFSGDLVFEYSSYGRTDLYGGDFQTIISSIKSLGELPGDTLIYPGHGSFGFTVAEYFGKR